MVNNDMGAVNCIVILKNFKFFLETVRQLVQGIGR